MPNAKPQSPDHKYAIGPSVQYATRGFSPQPPAAPELSVESIRTIHDIAKTLAEQSLLRPAEKSAPLHAEPTSPELELPTEKQAVWIVHGMGQQLPFETLDQLAGGILAITTPVPGQPPPVVQLMPGHPPRVAAAKFLASVPGEKAQVVERVELDLQVQQNHTVTSTFQLHLYEAYWAPLTEGAAKLSDVISFFFTAAVRGFANVFKPFQRAMFPDQNP